MGKRGDILFITFVIVGYWGSCSDAYSSLSGGGSFKWWLELTTILQCFVIKSSTFLFN